MRSVVLPAGAAVLAVLLLGWVPSPAQAAAPSLSLQPTNNGRFRLSWPAPSTGFALEQTDSLSPPVDWQTVAAQPQLQGTSLGIEMVTAPASRFYRLRSPAVSGFTTT